MLHHTTQEFINKFHPFQVKNIHLRCIKVILLMWNRKRWCECTKLFYARGILFVWCDAASLKPSTYKEISSRSFASWFYTLRKALKLCFQTRMMQHSRKTWILWVRLKFTWNFIFSYKNVWICLWFVPSTLLEASNVMSVQNLFLKL